MKYEVFLTDFERARIELAEFVVVTLTDFQGSAPQVLGARMIASRHGYYSGTVGGGKLEKAAIDKARAIIESTRTSSASALTWNLQRDLGMSCGGTVTLLFEYQAKTNDWPIAIFGAGHVAQELARVLSRLNCNIKIFDSRPEWLEKLPKNINNLEAILCDSLADAAKLTSEDAFVVVATMGHSTDLPVLKELLIGRKIRYVGAIGSAVKAKKMRGELIDLGVSREACEALFCPIGEDFGNNTPSEIAISIAAQLLKQRDKINERMVKMEPSTRVSGESR
jgi:xanthine dehydrogenase accessory factor